MLPGVLVSSWAAQHSHFRTEVAVHGIVDDWIDCKVETEQRLTHCVKYIECIPP